MTQDEFNAYCATLPHTSHVVQWGGADVWKVGSPAKNKVFVVGGWQKNEQSGTAVSEINYAASFKCGEIGFEMLRDTPGCRPAPYLASRGMKWIQCFDNTSLSDADLFDYIKDSHRRASLNLTKKLQRELGLNQGGGDA